MDRFILSNSRLRRKRLNRVEKRGQAEIGFFCIPPIRTNLRKDEAKRRSICDDIRKGIQISIPEGAVPW